VLPQGHRSHCESNPGSHTPPAVPSLVQNEAPTRGHAIPGQAAGLPQVTSQRHAFAHPMKGQAAAPEHWTWHRVVAQSIAWHEPWPLQLMSQLLPAPHVTSPHAPELLQRTVQSNPAGHVTSPHGLPAVHSIRQVMAVRSHDVHPLGHSG